MSKLWILWLFCGISRFQLYSRWFNTICFININAVIMHAACVFDIMKEYSNALSLCVNRRMMVHVFYPDGLSHLSDTACSAANTNIPPRNTINFLYFVFAISLWPLSSNSSLTIYASHETSIIEHDRLITTIISIPGINNQEEKR